jgi:predicted RNA-binding Zn-ribbon protein involved in translation (DUF1610 family)
MNQYKNGDQVGCNNCGNPYEYKKGGECPNCGKDFIGSVKRIRKQYTNETYSPKFTKELLFNLFNFLNMKIVEEKELFSEYDRASLLCAIEHIDELEKLKEAYFSNSMNQLDYLRVSSQVFDNKDNMKRTRRN